MANCDNTVLLQKLKKHNPDRKFKGFFRPKLGDLQKKKKRSSPKFRVNFRPKSKIERFFPHRITKLGDTQKKKGLRQNSE